jgi:hypothetical protein
MYITDGMPYISLQSWFSGRRRWPREQDRSPAVENEHNYQKVRRTGREQVDPLDDLRDDRRGLHDPDLTVWIANRFLASHSQSAQRILLRDKEAPQ